MHQSIMEKLEDMDIKHTNTLQGILAQTTKTNGKVAQNQKDIGKIKRTLIIIGSVTGTLLLTNGSELINFLLKII